MEHYFDAIFTCSEVGHGKDEPVIFQKAMDHFSSDRSTTVVFEDAPYAIHAAKEAGCYVYAVPEKTYRDDWSDCEITADEILQL